MIRICIFIFALTVLNSCGNKNKIPQGILKPEKMQLVLWDVMKAEAFTADFIKKDSSKNALAENLKLQQEIFAIHKISKADFYSSYNYYKTNTPLFKTMLDSLIKKMDRNKHVNPQPLLLKNE